MLHVVDTHTRFQGVAVLRSKSGKDVWSVIMECWVSLDLGYPLVMRVDEESAIGSDLFKATSTVNGILLQISGVESHNSLGTGERYRAQLGRAFLELGSKHP